jgi:hypothetical protein
MATQLVGSKAVLSSIGLVSDPEAMPRAYIGGCKPCCEPEAMPKVYIGGCKPCCEPETMPKVYTGGCKPCCELIGHHATKM